MSDYHQYIENNPDQFIYNEQDGEYVLCCLDCKKPYEDFPLDVIIPDDQWEAITGRNDGGGILCSECIIKRGEKLPGITVAKLRFE